MRKKISWYLMLLVGVAACSVLPMACKTMQEEWAKEKGEEQETEVSLEQVPGAVRATILKEAGGQKIDEVEVTGEGDAAVYETDLRESGREIELRVAADGRVISKNADDEDDETGESKEER